MKSTQNTMKSKSIKEAFDRAVAEAKAYFKSRYEYAELWEISDCEITIRAWTVEDDDGENDYEFFSVPLR